MSSKRPRDHTEHIKFRQEQNNHSRTATPPIKNHHLLLYTLKAQLPIILTILLSEVFMHFVHGSGNIIVVVLLGMVIYSALAAGQRQGVISALLVVLYDYIVIILAVKGDWVTVETLGRGAVIAISFPLIAFIIGRLADRNAALLQSEQETREEAEASERQLRFMAESMPQKIFTMKPNGEADYSNPQWKEYTDHVTPQGKTLDWSQVVHPDDAKENAELWQRSLETGEPFQIEHRLKRSDGKYIWHITRAHALRDERGSITVWVGSTTDIEDVRRTRKLEASTARLIKQRAQLMELNTAKDEFISLASHQLRTPATGVKQYINMALDGYAGKVTPKLRTFLEKANSSNERQLSVINDLLRVAQMDAGKVILHKENIDLSKLITNIVQEQRSKFADRNQALTFKKPKEKLKVVADATKLRMILENIVDNASKYTPAGKNVTVHLTRSRQMVRIAIKDEGVGIAQEDVERIFQKFLRLDNPMSMEVGGTGLGLYWVQKVVELHGGNISVTSKIGEGSTFTIALPMHTKT